ncbi:MAG: hypothetical protein ACK4ON_07225 [Bacteroidia bacterium]
MKRIYLASILILCLVKNSVFAQNQPPSFNISNGSDWAGGTNNAAPNWANTLGTSANNTHPVYFVTNGAVRAKMNSN